MLDICAATCRLMADEGEGTPKMHEHSRTCSRCRRTRALAGKSGAAEFTSRLPTKGPRGCARDYRTEWGAEATKMPSDVGPRPKKLACARSFGRPRHSTSFKNRTNLLSPSEPCVECW